MRPSHAVFLLAWTAAFVALHGCTAAQLDNIDPVCIVKDQTCPDARGVPRPLQCGMTCCAWQNLGPGQCGENESCMLPDGCSSPLPPNDPSAGYGARKLTRRSGL